MDTNVRKILAIIMVLFSTNAYCSPSNTISIPNSFTAGTTISSSKTNENNNEVQSKFNAHSHSDITQLGSVTSGTWGATAVGTQYGGTGEDFSSVVSGGIIYFDGTGNMTTLAKGASGAILYFNHLTLQPAWLTPGTSGEVLTSNGVTANPSWESGSKLVQVVNSLVASQVNITATIPQDTSKPQITEGTEVITCSITPTSATNKLLIQATINGKGGATNEFSAALFQDATANALCANSNSQVGSNYFTMPLTYYMTAGTTSSTTFSIRVGSNTGGTNMTVNDPTFDGVNYTTLTVTEISA